MSFLGIGRRNIVDDLRSDEGRSEIRSQILEAFESDAITLQLRDVKAQLRSESEAAGDRLKRTSKELRTELDAALNQEAERLRSRMVKQIDDFLRSTEGRELIVGLLIEALATRELDVLIKDAEVRLKELASNLSGDAEVAIRKAAEKNRVHLQTAIEEFDRDAGAMTLTLSEMVFREAEVQLQAKHGSLVASAWEAALQRLDQFIQFELPNEIGDAIERHVAARHWQPISNRRLASELGMSVRAVKRRRRRMRDGEAC